MLQLKVVVFIVIVKIVNSAPTNDGDPFHPQSESDLFSDKKPVTLVKFINEPMTEDTRQYKFEYETSDGQGREEIGKIIKNKDGEEYLRVRGSYSYIGPDGVLYSVFYTADEYGFQATGEHIPGKENELPVVQIDRNAIISLLG